MVYSTGAKRNYDSEPWHIFLTLLHRNYGDSLCKNLSDAERTAEVDNCKNAVEDRKRKRRASVSNDTGHVQSAVNESSTNTEKAAENAAPSMIEAENKAFLQQLQIYYFSKMTLDSSLFWLIKKGGSFHSTNRCIGATARPALVPQRTKNARQAANVLQSQPPFTTELEPAVPEPSRFSPQNVISESSRGESTHSLTSLSNVEFGSGTSNIMSPSKESTLPDDVRSSMEMMLQQNSVEFCRNFADLAKRLNVDNDVEMRSTSL
ncbi:unnamed protein product [Gongylonema pulchrum]|uniref:Uncharacterized protein n=1 Tax=Gongylonema pulchrum TaxID=637853 RepID=A0A3P7MKC3_9BILA|nr:unnamed protein product [Gongylonema pulchrum]